MSPMSHASNLDKGPRHLNSFVLICRLSEVRPSFSQARSYFLEGGIAMAEKTASP
jgi:hypothetical protein